MLVKVWVHTNPIDRQLVPGIIYDLSGYVDSCYYIRLCCDSFSGISTWFARDEDITEIEEDEATMIILAQQG